MTIPKLSIGALHGLGRAALHPLAYRARAIGPRLRERIILRVSSVNSCVVCSAIHSGVARAVGVSEEQVRQARDREQEPDDERTRAALRYAELRTADLERDFPEDVARFEKLFDAREREEVRMIVDAFTFANRFNNTWESLIPGRSWRRRKLRIG